MRIGFTVVLTAVLAIIASATIVEGANAVQTGETLYNGIVLPSPWPPKVSEPTREPMPPPYLTSPPAIIPIRVGRQLFVDDFLVENTTLVRTFHLAAYHPQSPVLRPDKSWEIEGSSHGGYPAPTAMVFSDGVWYDPCDKLFKMWYMGEWHEDNFNLLYPMYLRARM